jgi:hypothetical protein
MSNEPSQLNADLATLLGFAVGNRTAAANAIKQAKEALSIDKATKSLTADDKAAIVQWHKDRLTDINQFDIESIAAVVALRTDNPSVINEPIETVPGVVENIADNAPLTELELLKLENAKLHARIAVIDAKHAPTFLDNQLIRLTVNGKQIALNGAYLNALMVSTGIDKKGVKTWLESSVNDKEQNITEQVKLLIVRNLESELVKARG